jgi:Holliday junction resolvasome RuvABC ATP-dependent DNA helicase subunit
VLGVMVDDIAARPDQWDDVIECERLYEAMENYAADTIADEQAAAEEYRNELRRD